MNKNFEPKSKVNKGRQRSRSKPFEKRVQNIQLPDNYLASNKSIEPRASSGDTIGSCPKVLLKNESRQLLVKHQTLIYEERKKTKRRLCDQSDVG